MPDRRVTAASTVYRVNCVLCTPDDEGVAAVDQGPQHIYLAADLAAAHDGAEGDAWAPSRQLPRS